MRIQLRRRAGRCNSQENAKKRSCMQQLQLREIALGVRRPSLSTAALMLRKVERCVGQENSETKEHGGHVCRKLHIRAAPGRRLTNLRDEEVTQLVSERRHERGWVGNRIGAIRDHRSFLVTAKRSEGGPWMSLDENSRGNANLTLPLLNLQA